MQLNWLSFPYLAVPTYVGTGRSDNTNHMFNLSSGFNNLKKHTGISIGSSTLNLISLRTKKYDLFTLKQGLKDLNHPVPVEFMCVCRTFSSAL